MAMPMADDGGAVLDAAAAVSTSHEHQELNRQSARGCDHDIINTISGGLALPSTQDMVSGGDSPHTEMERAQYNQELNNDTVGDFGDGKSEYCERKAVRTPAPAGPSSASSGTGAAPTAEELLERGRLMLLSGSGSIVPSGRSPVAKEATNQLVEMARDAVQQLFTEHSDELKRTFTVLDKEETLGFLLGDLLRGELLQNEARAIGKRAGTALARLEKTRSLFKAAAKSKATNAAAKAKKTENLAMAAAVRAASQAELANKYDQLRNDIMDLDLPPPKSVIKPTRTSRPAPKRPRLAPVELEAAQAVLASAQRRKRKAWEALTACRTVMPDMSDDDWLSFEDGMWKERVPPEWEAYMRETARKRACLEQWEALRAEESAAEAEVRRLRALEPPLPSLDDMFEDAMAKFRAGFSADLKELFDGYTYK